MRTLPLEVEVEPVLGREVTVVGLSVAGRDILPVVVVWVSGRAVTVLGREVVVLVPVLGRAVTVLPRDEPVDVRPEVEVTLVEERCVELVVTLSLLMLLELVAVRAELGVATLCLLLEVDREVELVVLLLVVGL